MLESSILGLRYHKTMADQVDGSFTGPLKTAYAYSFVVSYGEFTDEQYEILDKKGSVIDLTAGLDAVVSRFSSTCQRQVRKATRIPELEFHREIDDFTAFYDFHCQAEHERNWYPVPREELEQCINIAATYQGQFISAISCYSSGKRLRVNKIFSRRSAPESLGLSGTTFSAASRRVVFEFCEWGIQQGFEVLDLAGVDFDDPLKAGISRFKASFGVDIVPVKIGQFATAEFHERQSGFREMGLDVS